MEQQDSNGKPALQRVTARIKSIQSTDYLQDTTTSTNCEPSLGCCCVTSSTASEGICVATLDWQVLKLAHGSRRTNVGVRVQDFVQMCLQVECLYVARSILVLTLDELKLYPRMEAVSLIVKIKVLFLKNITIGLKRTKNLETRRR